MRRVDCEGKLMSGRALICLQAVLHVRVTAG
jgi:hypothetical protein